MKKLIFGLIAIVMFGLVGNAQTSTNRMKLFCITVSCCSIGPVGVEVWHETTCHYVSVHKTAKGDFNYSVKFESKEDLKEIKIEEDVLLAGFLSEEGENLILPAGNYYVENNEMFFNPVSFKARRYCYERDVKGNLLGHDYSYHIEICVSFGKSSKGIVGVSPKFTDEQLLELQKNDNVIELYDDIVVKDENVNYTFKSGKYTVNEDGVIYVQNTELK